MSKSPEPQNVPPGAYAVTFGIATYIMYNLNMKTAALIFFIIAALCLIAQFVPGGEKTSAYSADTKPSDETPLVSEISPASVPVPSVDSSPAAPSVRVNSILPESIRGHEIAYRYTDVGIFVPKDATFDVDGFVPGALLTLFADKENEYDANAVGLRLRKRLVGYLYRGKLQDMANDWLKKRLPMRAVLTKTERVKNRADVTLAFYDLSDFKKLLRRYPDAKKYRLTYNSGEEMQNNLLLCSRGDECDISYDADRGRYLVSSGLDIGYLPASAEKLVEQFGDESCRLFIADLYTNDSGKTVATVYVFPKRSD